MNYKITVDQTDSTGHPETIVHLCKENEICKVIQQARTQGFISLCVEQVKSEPPKFIYVKEAERQVRVFNDFTEACNDPCNGKIYIYQDVTDKEV